MTVGRERTYATLQEVALELLDVVVRRSHATRFAVLRMAPAKNQAPPRIGIFVQSSPDLR
jgi:hypothetical protein